MLVFCYGLVCAFAKQGSIAKLVAPFVKPKQTGASS
jgi:hypothetical protein